MGMKEEYEKRRELALARKKEMDAEKKLKDLKFKKEALKSFGKIDYKQMEEIEEGIGKINSDKKSKAVQDKTREDFERQELKDLELITGSKIGAKRRQKKLDEEDEKRRLEKKKK